MSYSFRTMKELARVTPKEELAIYPPYRMANPISADHEYLRPTLRASILETLPANRRSQEGKLRIFEAARTYQRPDERPPASGHPFGEEALPDEREHVV